MTERWVILEDVLVKLTYNSLFFLIIYDGINKFNIKQNMHISFIIVMIVIILQ